MFSEAIDAIAVRLEGLVLQGILSLALRGTVPVFTVAIKNDVIFRQKEVSQGNAAQRDLLQIMELPLVKGLGYGLFNGCEALRGLLCSDDTHTSRGAAITIAGGPIFDGAKTPLKWPMANLAGEVNHVVILALVMKMTWFAFGYAVVFSNASGVVGLVIVQKAIAASRLVFSHEGCTAVMEAFCKTFSLTEWLAALLAQAVIVGRHSALLATGAACWTAFDIARILKGRAATFTDMFRGLCLGIHYRNIIPFFQARKLMALERMSQMGLTPELIESPTVALQEVD